MLEVLYWVTCTLINLSNIHETSDEVSCLFTSPGLNFHEVLWKVGSGERSRNSLVSWITEKQEVWPPWPGDTWVNVDNSGKNFPQTFTFSVSAQSFAARIGHHSSLTSGLTKSRTLSHVQIGVNFAATQRWKKGYITAKVLRLFWRKCSLMMNEGETRLEPPLWKSFWWSRDGRFNLIPVIYSVQNCCNTSTCPGIQVLR